jgi:hypothetical protein
MAYSMASGIMACDSLPKGQTSSSAMRIPLSLLALAAVLGASPAAAQRLGAARGAEQDAAYRAMTQGDILPFSTIRARINVPGAQFIGVEFDGRIYRLKFMRGAEVIWIDVDARTGRVVGRQ